MSEQIDVQQKQLYDFDWYLSLRVSSVSLNAARAQAAELRFSQLKERHAELITSHADLMKKVKWPEIIVSFALSYKNLLEYRHNICIKYSIQV